jgi:deoxycytidylate deaminase
MSIVGPCAKQTVTATIVTIDGQRFVGTNHCLSAQEVCPRAHLPTGVGYEMCRNVCRQPAHAEVNALAAARDAARGATLYLEGHTYACDDCLTACDGFGIAKVIIGAPPAP